MMTCTALLGCGACMSQISLCSLSAATNNREHPHRQIESISNCRFCAAANPMSDTPESERSGKDLKANLVHTAATALAHVFDHQTTIRKTGTEGLKAQQLYGRFRR
ncbi:hypothetical protein [Paraburkholderia sp. BL10I2N1]|uniref:hypothetical protein n=1 Tax=Paraburkholderia sp. BL10I2N1 TaxID=1938796 RepID=UPI001415304A|nr:hypothetical protein [Paraburkholderia sp. BL10I2N1]